jgi:hypothetical protein
MNIESVLKNLVRIGTASSVDTEKRLVRVTFNDKQDVDGKPLVSGPLKVLQNQPLVTIEKWSEDFAHSLNKWDYETEYNSHDRKIGIGESYVKTPYETLKDVVKNEKVITHGKEFTISGPSLPCTCGASAGPCPMHGETWAQLNRQTVTVYPWLPYVGQLVVCLYLPNGDCEGFVLGGI